MGQSGKGELSLFSFAFLVFLVLQRPIAVTFPKNPERGEGELHTIVEDTW